MKTVAVVGAVLLLWRISQNAVQSHQRERSGAEPDTSPAQCYQPLSAYCQGTNCRDYARSLAAVRRFGASGHCMFASAGKCGALRFTGTADGFVSGTEYFDASGRLVGAHRTTDAFSSNPTCPNWRTFGQRIDCTFTEVVEYCDVRSSRSRQTHDNEPDRPGGGTITRLSRSKTAWQNTPNSAPAASVAGDVIPTTPLWGRRALATATATSFTAVLTGFDAATCTALQSALKPRLGSVHSNT